MGQPGHVPALRIYCKQQKLSERKVSWLFDELQKFSQQMSSSAMAFSKQLKQKCECFLYIWLKSVNCETFLSLDFCCLWYIKQTSS